MKDIDDVLTGFDAIMYFLESDDGVDDYESIWKLETYRKSIRRHLMAIIPSLIFIVLLSLMFLVFLIYSPNIMNDFSFFIVIGGTILTLLYIIYVDISRFRMKHDKFILGNVVGTSKDDEKFKKKYYLIFMVDNEELVAAQVSKNDYIGAKPNKEYLIFLEGEGLYAVKK